MPTASRASTAINVSHLRVPYSPSFSLPPSSSADRSNFRPPLIVALVDPRKGRSIERFSATFSFPPARFAESRTNTSDSFIQSKSFQSIRSLSANDCGLRCRKGACSRSGECVCRFGYQGPNCDQCVRAVGCANGFCSRPHECVCFPGFSGSNCTQKMAVCEAQLPCLNGGTCYNRPQGRFECKCTAGYAGTRCERPVEDCATANPCQNNGVCAQVSSFRFLSFE